MTEQFWARKRLQLIAEAGRRIGGTLDVRRTAEELTDVIVPALADFVSVDLVAALDDIPEPPARVLPADGPLLLRRVALRSVTPGARRRSWRPARWTPTRRVRRPTRACARDAPPCTR
ncbi:hypothetical protein STAFG_6090 [Streptomyces afghaniensis 772]|uniref:Uncharacterized protein n=1 Tax=Streptomyces afghaniensis 772 TaxID=1283301 RepID=S4MJR6_9ACTN|nr:hypothetical protein STAFG_6090 [Streptomyces afghaniensis 772]